MGRPLDALLVPHVGEFAHLHPGYDGSLHVALPGPRDHEELEVVFTLAANS